MNCELCGQPNALVVLMGCETPSWDYHNDDEPAEDPIKRTQWYCSFNCMARHHGYGDGV
jgi:hypothetical protein